MNRLHTELRAAEITGNTLAGHAAVFGQVASIRGGYEALAATAFDEVLTRDDDVVALRDHNPELLLGRTRAGTLRLSTDRDGLVFEVDLPDTAYAHDVRELVRRGDLAGASFGFIPGRDELGHAPDGKQLRTHTSISKLIDVSVVAIPAYDGTDVALRHVEFDLPSTRARSQAIRVHHRARYTRRDQ